MRRGRRRSRSSPPDGGRYECSRRQVLRLMAGAGAVLAAGPRLAVGQVGLAAAARPYGFLTADELAILDAAAAVILPTDDLPGAREVGVVDYVQTLLSFLPGSDANCDRAVGAADLVAIVRETGGAPGVCAPGGDVNGDGAVDAADVPAAESALFGARPTFGGGPFSGRTAQPHFPIGTTACQSCHGATAAVAAGAAAGRGTTVDAVPPNAFRQFLPLNRLQRLSWTVRLLGVEAAPELADNPLARSGPDLDLRRRYRDGLAALDAGSQQQFGRPFVELSAADQAKVLDRAPADFVQLLQRHVIEGALCAPEYGGNRDRLGWQLVRFDGDSQPLGYEIYDATLPGYRERADKPNSGPDPGDPCAPFSDKMVRFLTLISQATGGGRLSAPCCFEVDDGCPSEAGG